MFVSVKFNPTDQRAYTYSYNGLRPLSAGDFVGVYTREGRKVVRVVLVDVPEPNFECKPIVSVLIEEEVR